LNEYLINMFFVSDIFSRKVGDDENKMFTVYRLEGMHIFCILILSVPIGQHVHYISKYFTVPVTPSIRVSLN